jgi:hypothetical protein
MILLHYNMPLFGSTSFFISYTLRIHNHNHNHNHNHVFYPRGIFTPNTD